MMIAQDAVRRSSKKCLTAIAARYVRAHLTTGDYFITTLMIVPAMSEKEVRWANIYVYSSFNNTLIHATDLSGTHTLAFSSGGRHVKADRLKPSQYAAMSAAFRVSDELKKRKITHVHILVRGVGGHGPKTPGQGAQSAIRAIARSGFVIGRIEDVTPLPSDGTRRAGGRRGRRM